MEREGSACREKVVDLRDRLSEATCQMNAMAGEYTAVKVRLGLITLKIDLILVSSASLANVISLSKRQIPPMCLYYMWRNLEYAHLNSK